jgi:hypothetical protein
VSGAGSADALLLFEILVILFSLLLLAGRLAQDGLSVLLLLESQT